MRSFFSARLFPVVAAAIICASVIVVYSNTFTSAFHLDDFRQIAGNPRIRNLTYLPYILFQELRGVTFHTFALNYLASGLDVTGFHLVNTLIHIISSILSYFVLAATFTRLSWPVPRVRAVAFFSALLFALHPVQTQSVTYIVQRMESLSALFCLLALLLFIFADGVKRLQSKILLYFGVLFTYVMAFYSKEIAITLPALIILYDYYFLSGFGLRGLVKRAPFYALLLTLLIYFAVSTIIPLGGFGDLSDGAIGSDGLSAAAGVVSSEGVAPRESWESAGFNVKGLSPSEYMYTQLNVLTYYITLLAVPVNQNIDYDFPVSTSLFKAPKVKGGTVLNYPQPPSVVSLLILALILCAAFYLARHSVGPATGEAESSKLSGGVRGTGAVASFFIFWFFITLSPTSSFIPIIDVIFEHRLYLASLGFFVVGVLAIVTLSERIFTSLDRRGENGASSFRR